MEVVKFMIIDKKQEVKSFSNQVRIICLKNSIDKTILGKKINMDPDMVFKEIKNASFKPDPQRYIKLESYICGKNKYYVNKLRCKYEKTLDMSELNEYTKLIKPRKHKETKLDLDINPDTTDSIESEIELNDKAEKEPKEKTTRKYLSDHDSRKKFHKIVMSNKTHKVSARKIREFLGNQRFDYMRHGDSFIPTEKLKEFLEFVGILPETEVYKELIELHLNCILGRDEENEFEKYIMIFNSSNDSKNEITDDVKEVVSVKKEINISIDNSNNSMDKLHEEMYTNDIVKEEYKITDFGHILTEWLFVNDYHLKSAARAIGCSDVELKDVVSGNSCLSPYHVNRFKETLNMDDMTISKLIKISNLYYKGHEIPESLLSYISSDMVIINTLEKIVKKKKDIAFWNKVKDMICYDSKFDK